MKKLCAVLLICLLTFGMSGIATATDDLQPAVIKKPVSVNGPYPVTLEEWTDIIRRLKKTPEKSREMLILITIL